jgi:hypothetical protein
VGHLEDGAVGMRAGAIARWSAEHFESMRRLLQSQGSLTEAAGKSDFVHVTRNRSREREQNSAAALRLRRNRSIVDRCLIGARFLSTVGEDILSPFVQMSFDCSLNESSCITTSLCRLREIISRTDDCVWSGREVCLVEWSPSTHPYLAFSICAVVHVVALPVILAVRRSWSAFQHT